MIRWCWCAGPVSAPGRPSRAYARRAWITHILDGGMNAWEAAGFAVKRGTQRWDLERQVRFVAGMIVALSVLIGAFVPGVQWVAFVMGSGLAAAAATNTCLMGMMLAKLPYNRSAACDAQTVVAQLVGSRPVATGRE